MECISSKTTDRCTCTYTSCDKRGNCCKCVMYHREKGEIPGCFFSAKGERSYDRSLRNFIKDKS
ncbi:MAG TPA: DUF6485 family protein [Geobacteraceae bacterium]|nr:DUF6485 family protein [Geobacteraceae bacterium]